MTRRVVAAFALGGVTLATSIATLAMLAVPPRQAVSTTPIPLPGVAALVLFALLTPVLGTLIAVRRPDNPTGWLFLAMTFPLAFGFLTDALVHRLEPSWTLGLVATIGSDVGGLWVASLLLMLLVFPNGSLPTPRARPVLGLLLLGMALLAASSLFAPDAGISPAVPGLPLPLARPDLAQAVNVVNAVGEILFVCAAIGSVPLLVLRFRRAGPVERQQLKWFVWAAGILLSLMIAGVLVQPFSYAVSNALWNAVLVALVLLPFAAAIAILRYGLFDIDLLINRTVVYAALTLVLGAAYAGSVLVLQQILAPLTSTNSLAVAASTLLVAALFQPVRRRVQAAVDRRFYRQRYSARREIARFGASLRDEVDVAHLEALLAATVDRTVQPAFASIWLRGGD